MDMPLSTVNPLALARMEWEILQLLLIAGNDVRRWPLLPLESVVAQTSDPVVAVEALAGLCEVGLVQRSGSEVMITRAALRFHQLTTEPPRAEWARPWAA
jgi:hypothetical protein